MAAGLVWCAIVSAAQGLRIWHRLDEFLLARRDRNAVWRFSDWLWNRYQRTTNPSPRDTLLWHTIDWLRGRKSVRVAPTDEGGARRYDGLERIPTGWDAPRTSKQDAGQCITLERGPTGFGPNCERP